MIGGDAPRPATAARLGVVIVLGRDAAALPAVVARWIASIGDACDAVDEGDELMVRALRGRPTAIVVDARADADSAYATVARVKRDAFTGVVPVVTVVATAAEIAPAFEAGADEVIAADVDEREATGRLAAVLRRSERDIEVHPTTRLPGTNAIEARITGWIASRGPFATCYADLDHFKEFNDRYGYNEGDRVIRMLALLLHDAVAGVCGERGFVGHIGGDDFIFIVPLEAMNEVCTLIVETFEELVPLQYSDADRRAGYYFGKDRRGVLHRVPLMSLSIGVVTTERRAFTHASQVSALASEMKSYAKAQPGSGYSVDRRNEPPPEPPRAARGRSQERA